MAIFMGLFPTVFLAPTAPAIDKVVQRAGQVQHVNVEARPVPSSSSIPDSASNPRTPNRQSSIPNRQ
jgi:hypothetical protein